MHINNGIFRLDHIARPQLAQSNRSCGFCQISGFKDVASVRGLYLSEGSFSLEIWISRECFFVYENTFNLKILA